MLFFALDVIGAMIVGDEDPGTDSPMLAAVDVGNDDGRVEGLPDGIKLGLVSGDKEGTKVGK